MHANPSARIHSIKGVHGNFCLGIEVTYDVHGEKISAGAHYGSNAESGAELTLELDDDEVIVAAWGGCGALIDRLCLRTNKGKEIRWGESDGGDDFEFKIPPGCHIIAFHGGHNGDMHNIGAYARRRIAHYTKFLEVGGTHGDTQAFDDFEFVRYHPFARIASIKGVSGDFCLGLEVTYEDNDEKITAPAHFGSNAASGEEVVFELDEDEVIVKASGGCGALIDRLILTTNKGNSIQFGNSDGGDEFVVEEEGKHLIAFYGGHNGDMHNLGAYFNAN